MVDAKWQEMRCVLQDRTGENTRRSTQCVAPVPVSWGVEVEVIVVGMQSAICNLVGVAKIPGSPAQKFWRATEQ